MNSKELFIGIDAGTTGLKAVVIDSIGTVYGKAYRTYPIDTPKLGYAEQRTELWWKALTEVVQEACSKLEDRRAVTGIGLSGQMHGTVFLNKECEPLCPAIIWCDQRSADVVAELKNKISDEQLIQWVQNPVATGFQVASILWLKKNRPEVYKEVCHVLLPKDYLRYLLTGSIGTEASDACSTMLFDCRKKTWSQDMLETVGLEGFYLPDTEHRSYETAGTLTQKAAEELGLNQSVVVAFGGGDQPMQALGNNILYPGSVLITLGTGGQVFVPTNEPHTNPTLNTHCFCHCSDYWYSMGAILNCCLAQNWVFKNVFETKDYAAIHELAATAAPGSDGLFFLPYLTGERTPYMNPDAKGIFWGLTLKHNKAAVARSVVEGISYAIKDAYTAVVPAEMDVEKIVLSGGGANSELWRQIIADMLGHDVYTTETTDEACVGAAICAMVAAGVYCNIGDAANAIVRMNDTPTSASKENNRFYEEQFLTYKRIYEANKAVFSET